MPGGRILALPDADLEQPSYQAEQPLQHARQRKVRAQFFLRDRKQLALQFLGPEAHIPGREFLHAGEFCQLCQFALRRGSRRGAQLIQQLAHVGGVACHAGGERQFGETGEIQQPRRFVPQSQDLLHERPVVPATRVRSAIRGAGRPGLVERLAQLRRLRVSQNRDVGWLVEAQQPALLARFAGAFFGLRDDGIVEPGEHGAVADRVTPGLGGIQHVFFELGAELRQLGHDFLVALLALARQCDAGEPEIAQREFQQAPLG